MDIKEAFELSAHNNSSIKEILNEVKLINISKEDIFDATRRAYCNSLGDLTDDEIVSYFALYDEKEIARHVYNIKGYVLEQEVEQELINNGFKASLHDNINHPETDISIENEEIIEYQIKATSDLNYINDTLNNTQNIEIITTSNIKNTNNDEMIHNTDIDDDSLEELVSDAINPISISIPGLLIKSALAAFGFFSI